MKRILSIFILLIVVFAIFTSCKPKLAPVNIISLNKAQGLRNYSNIYALPKTVIKVNVTAERVNYVKGPYSDYARVHLGLEDIIEENMHKWRISAIEFETYAIADTNNLFLIETNIPEYMLLLSLTKEGFIKSINDASQTGKIVFQNEELNEWLNRKKISSAGNIELNDPVSVTFDDVPLPKDVLQKKIKSEQALALVNKILILRDDRSAILVGDGYTQALPVGETMQTMITEIDKIEEKYLSLFKGKIVKESFSYSFTFIPDEPRKRTQSILFRFSEKNGIVQNSDISGIPVVIEIESYENLKQFEQFKKRQFYLESVSEAKQSQKGFFYRIPEMGNVRLLKNDKVLTEDKILIAQFGTIQHLPYKYLHGNYSIHFYPELGSLQSIFLNEQEMPQLKHRKRK
jgi:hypothetical protein